MDFIDGTWSRVFSASMTGGAFAKAYPNGDERTNDTRFARVLVELMGLGHASILP